MPFFKVSLNDKNEIIVGDESFELLEVGLLTVGPKYDIDLLAHGVVEGATESTDLLNEKVYTGDVVKVTYLEDSPSATNKFSCLSKEKETEDSCDVRKFKIKQGNSDPILISASGSSSLSANFIWHKKSDICSLLLGNTDYNNNEQWMKLDIIEHQEYIITIVK